MQSLTENSRLQEIFDAIPKEIWFQIFAYLDAGSLSRFACVSKFWKSVADDKKLWKSICDQEKINVPECADPKTIFIQAFKAEVLRRSKMSYFEIMKEKVEEGKLKPVSLLLFASPAWSGH